MTQQTIAHPLAPVALLLNPDDSHQLLRQLVTEAERATVAPREEVALVKPQQPVSARQKEVATPPTRVRYAMLTTEGAIRSNDFRRRLSNPKLIPAWKKTLGFASFWPFVGLPVGKVGLVLV